MSRPPEPEPRTPDPGPRLLIIRPSALGDVARTAACLVSLRAAFPGAKLEWLVDRRFADAVRAHPALDGVVAFDRRSKASVLPLLRRLRAADYQIVFDLQGLARSGLFAWATRAPRRVGFADARELGWLGLNQRHRVDPTRHAADRMLALLEAAGVPRVEDYTLHVPPEARGFGRAMIEHHNRRGTGVHAVLSTANHRLEACATDSEWDEHYVCVAPTAQWGCKCWPAERYVEVAQRLLEQGRQEGGVSWLAVLAAPNERERVVEAWTAALPAELLGRVAFPSTSVGQMMDLIAGSRLLVGNDSAPLHLAVGLDTPTVSLFGPTDPARVGPPPMIAGKSTARRHRVLRAPSAIGRTFNYRRHRQDDTLMRELGVEAVWDAVAESMRLTQEKT